MSNCAVQLISPPLNLFPNFGAKLDRVPLGSASDVLFAKNKPKAVCASQWSFFHSSHADLRTLAQQYHVHKKTAMMPSPVKP